MFGGSYGSYSSAFDNLNDFWRFDQFNQQWTWIGGDTVLNSLGTYGSLGQYASANMPSSRRIASMIYDRFQNKIHLFGGYGSAVASSAMGTLNDFWSYDVNLGQWAWVSGTNIINDAGVAGTLNVPSTSNVPASRYYQNMALDSNGMVYIIGGNHDAGFAFGSCNDTWRYDLCTNTWAWVAGTQTIDDNGSFGTLNTPAATNVPSARYGQTVATNANARYYMFGGLATGGTNQGFANDLWIYDPILVGSPCVTVPNLPAQTPAVSAVANTTAHISMRKGNGNRRLIVLRKGSTLGAGAVPVNGTQYNASTVFGNGQQLGAGIFAMYAGVGNAINVSGLLPGTAYTAASYEYNDRGSFVLYSQTPITVTFTTTGVSTGVDETPATLVAPYPNPFTHAISVTPAKNGTISLIDMAGRTLETQNGFAGQQLQLGQDMAPGIYMLHIGTSVQRIVKVQ